MTSQERIDHLIDAGERTQQQWACS
jgi:hypothetical protein